MNTQLQLGPRTHRLTTTELRARWHEMRRDPRLSAIPYKLELNERGSMEVNLATARHSWLQEFVANELRRQKPEGTTFVDCPIETELGVRLPDVAWGTPEFNALFATESPLSSAPDLCIEIASSANLRAELLDKVTAYLAAGAREVWLISEDGTIEILSQEGAQERSAFDIELKLPPLDLAHDLTRRSAEMA